MLTFSTTFSPVALGLAGSGVNVIRPLGVHALIRPYNWLPYAALALPGDFTQVQ
jgi:hypothetical protein